MYREQKLLDQIFYNHAKQNVVKAVRVKFTKRKVENILLVLKYRKNKFIPSKIFTGEECVNL